MLPIAASTLLDPAILGEAVNTARAAADATSEQIAKVASDFESLFASQLLKELRQTLEPDSLFSGDSGDIYGGMFDLFLGQQISRDGGLGLSRVIREALQATARTTTTTAGAGTPLTDVVPPTAG